MYNRDVGMTLEEVIQQYKPLVYDLANNIYYRWYDKDDIAQELFIKLMGAYHSYKKHDGSEFFTYLYHVLQNHIRNLIKHNKAYQRDTMVDSIDYVIYQDGHKEITLADTIAEPDRHNPDYHQAIEELYRMPNGWITLAWLNGWSYKEIGDMIGKTFQWVHTLNKQNISYIRRIFVCDNMTGNDDKKQISND